MSDEKYHPMSEYLLPAGRQCQVPDCQEAAAHVCDPCGRLMCDEHSHHFNPDECAAQCETTACEVCCER